MKSQYLADSTATQLRSSCNSMANHCDLKSFPVTKCLVYEAILLAEEEMFVLATAALVIGKKRKKRWWNRRKL